jgi:hypothetical protein
MPEGILSLYSRMRLCVLATRGGGTAAAEKGLVRLMRLRKFLRKLREAAAVAFLVVFSYSFSLLSYFFAKKLDYLRSVALFGASLFLGVIILVYLHDYLRGRFDWDMLKLEYLNSLRKDEEEEEIAAHNVYMRLTRFIMRKGYWAILLLGPLFLGPFLVTVLLRKQKTWRHNASYTLFGAFYNAFFAVASAKGAVALVWKYLYL